MWSSKVWVACRKSLHHRNHQHQHHYQISRFLTSIGYECAAYVDRDLDLTLLERSLRSGSCKLVIEKSKAVDAVRTYDLLTDLAASDDVDLQQLYVVHTLTSSATSDVEYSNTKDMLEKEVSAIQGALRSKTINAFTLPISSVMLTNGHNSDGWMKRNLDLIRGALKQPGDGTAVGLDLPTEWLATASTEDIDRLLACVEACGSSYSGSTGSRPVGSGSPGIGLLSIATNAFTHHHAGRIFRWARDAGVRTVATELLRCHSRRPGLLSVAGGRHKLTHLDPTTNAMLNSAQHPGHINTNPQSSTSSSSTSTTSPEYTTLSHAQVAVETMKNALNACIHTEKQFLERFQNEAGVDPQALCWGHILSQTQHTILFPEEWDYFHANQIDPRLTAALDALKAKDRATNEWAMLYGPLAKNLFASFAVALETRRMSLCHEVYSEITRSHPISSSGSSSSSSSHSSSNGSSGMSSGADGKSGSSSSSINGQSRTPSATPFQPFKGLPWSLATAAGALGCDHIALSSTEILSDILVTNKTIPTSTSSTVGDRGEKDPNGMNSIQAAAMFDDVRTLLVAFQDEQSS